MDKIKVLVADGQRLFADSLAVALRTFPGIEVIDALPVSGHDALRAATKHSPNVVLMDYWIPGMPATAATAALLRNRPNTKVLMLGWFVGPREEIDSREAGAVALLNKDIDVARLTEIIRKPLPAETDEIVATASGSSGRASPSLWRRVARLKPREVEVLELLMFGNTRAETAVQLGIAPRTVRNLMHSVLAKTGARSQAEALEMTIGAGGITPLKRDPEAPRSPSIPPKQGDPELAGYPRVLVADSQLLFADALARSLREWWLPVIDEYPTSPDDILEAVRTHRPEVVMIDYWLDGIDTTRAIATFVPDITVIASSWLFEAGQVRAALEAGVAGFLPKNVTVPVVAAAIRQGAAGYPLIFGESLAAWLDWLTGLTGLNRSTKQRFEDVTRRELEVLKLLVEGRPPADVAQKLSITEATVRVHQRNLLRKTGAGSQAELHSLARIAHLASF